MNWKLRGSFLIYTKRIETRICWDNSSMIVQGAAATRYIMVEMMKFHNTLIVNGKPYALFTLQREVSTNSTWDGAFRCWSWQKNSNYPGPRIREERPLKRKAFRNRMVCCYFLEKTNFGIECSVVTVVFNFNACDSKHFGDESSVVP